MKKSLKKKMRYEGYTIDIINKNDCVFCWLNEGVHNVILGKNVSSSDFRRALGDNHRIISVDNSIKKIKIEVNY